MQVQTFNPGEVIAAYAGYLNRGLSEEDANLAMARFSYEHPGQEIGRHEIAPGKWQAFVVARERVEVVIDGDIVTDEDELPDGMMTTEDD